MDKLDEFMHPSTKFPWLILALAIFQCHNAIAINSYQSEGGFCPQTTGIAFACHLLFMLGMATWWFFLLPLLFPILVWAFAIFWGYKVMQKSK